MKTNKTAAVIMAGGRGERLSPVTDTVPKPVVPIGSGSGLYCAARMLFEAGIEECAVTVRYKAEEIKRICGEGLSGVRFIYYYENSPCGTAGGVREAAELLGDFDELIVLSGDAVSDLLLERVLTVHRLNGCEATLMLARSDTPEKYGVVETDEHGRILRFREKPTDALPGALVNTGIYVLSRRALEMIPLGREYDFGRDLFPMMLLRGERMYGTVGEGYWCDMGTPETYIMSCRDAATGKIRGISAKVERFGAIAHKSVRVGEGSVLSGCVLHEGVTVGRDVRAAEAILCRGVTVGSRVSIGKGAVVGADSFIGDGVRIPDGTKIAPNSKIESGAGIFAENL